MSIHTDGTVTDFIFIALVICLTFLVCEIITIFKIRKDKKIMKITLNLVKSHPVIRVSRAVDADAVRMMERGLVAYYTIQKVLSDCQNDPEQSEEFNNGVKKCLELVNACERGIILNSEYEKC